MIPKRVMPRSKAGQAPQHYDYAGLGNYIADTKHEGKKLAYYWTVNCEAGNARECLVGAIAEIKTVQQQNVRAKSDKTYHLMVSFRQEDKTPPEDVLRDIEKHFAEVLGFAEHQRVVGVHKDTDNTHMHIGYNRVHPENFTCKSVSHDYKKLEDVCRAMEKKHNLAVDLGRADKQEASKVPTGARDMEAHRWEQSFDSYVRGHKQELLKVVDTASNWQDVHDGFGEYNLELKKQGNGLIIASKANKKHRMKASSLDRGFSKASLEKRFGAFQSLEDGKEKTAKDSYKPRPTTKHKGQDKLWKQYRANRNAWHKGWKSFLYRLAMVQDPLARTIINAQNRLINSILPSQKSERLLPLPPARKTISKPRRDNSSRSR